MWKPIILTRDSIYMQYPSSWWRETWREALVSGNGHTGVSFYGGTKEQTLMVTDGGLWYDGEANKLPDVHHALERMRSKMDQGMFKEASWELVNELKRQGYHSKLESPLPVGDLKIQIVPHGTFHDYLRVLQMDTGEVSCQWRDQDVRYRCDGFVSRADDMILYRIQASTPVICANFMADIHTVPGLEIPECYQKIAVQKHTEVTDDWILYESSNLDGRYFGMAIHIVSNGTQKSQFGRIFVESADEITVMIHPFINETSKKGLPKAKDWILSHSKSYDDLLAAHIPLHTKLYHSAELELDGYHEKSNESLLHQAFTSEQSPELMEKMWKFGRYLFISGTSENDAPFALYGIWSGNYQPIWAHNMANENTQMIYWHSFVGNLADFHRSLFRYYNSKIATFRENAQKLFGCRGIYMTAGTTPGVSEPTQVVPVIINWVGAAGWIAQHYSTYVCYRPEDENYIKSEILPYLEEVAAFYEDFIQYKQDGSIKVYPSVSPENTPQNFMPPLSEMIAHPMPTTINSTIDLAIIKEFFTNLIHISEKYDCFHERRAGWEKILRSIPPYKTNELGAIREWQDEQFEDRYDHRHLSHIYPVFPGNEVNTVDQPQEIKKYKKAVALRKIDAQTGWSMVHMAIIYARFDEGETAAQCLDNMAKSCLLPNFFTLHNDWRGMSITLDIDSAPVQLDAALGYVDAIQEMILYASKDLLKILPALPKRMNAGKVQHFCYPDGEISIDWNRSEYRLDIEMQAARAHTIRIVLPAYADSFIWGNSNIREVTSGIYEISFKQKGDIMKGQNQK